MSIKNQIIIYFVRHGESLANLDDSVIQGIDPTTPLTRLGIQQSRAAGIALRELLASPPYAYYTSPAKRTRQTLTEILRDAPPANSDRYIEDEVLRELSQGTSEGRHRNEVYTDEIRQLVNMQGKNFKFPKGESMQDAAIRLSDWVLLLKETIGNKNTIHPTVVVVITHAMLIRSYVSHLLHWSVEETYTSRLENGSITIIDATDNPRVITYNNTSHLTESVEE